MFPIRDTIPSRHTPVMTWALIAANVLVYFYQVSLPDDAQQQLVYVFGIVPARFIGGFLTGLWLYRYFLRSERGPTLPRSGRVLIPEVLEPASPPPYDPYPRGRW